MNALTTAYHLVSMKYIETIIQYADRVSGMEKRLMVAGKYIKEEEKIRTILRYFPSRFI